MITAFKVCLWPNSAVEIRLKCRITMPCSRQTTAMRLKAGVRRLMKNLSKSMQLPLSILAAVLIGFVLIIFVIAVRSYIQIYFSITNWLIPLDLPRSLFITAIYIYDLLLNILLCIPAAYLLSRLQPQNLALYLALAVLPGFIWQHSNLFTNPTTFSPFLTFVPGITMALVMLPFATLIVIWARRRRNA